MNLIPESDDLNKYLVSSEIIDFRDTVIQKTAKKIVNGIEDEYLILKTVFEYVRDNISHSMDIDEEKLTFRASEVLKYGHGLCFAKSNLLAAFLRIFNIPTGFCYQKLEFDDGWELHGLNAVYLENMDKWIRIDARGNREYIKEPFDIKEDILAYRVRRDVGELDFLTIYSNPYGKVSDIIYSSNDLMEAVRNILNIEWKL